MDATGCPAEDDSIQTSRAVVTRERDALLSLVMGFQMVTSRRSQSTRAADSDVLERGKHSKGVSPRLEKRRVPLGGVPRMGSGPGTFPNFAYHGGRVIHEPQVFTLFLGDWSSAANQTRANRLNQFVTDLMNSDYMNMLAQYGCGSTGTLVNSLFIASSDHNLNRSDIESVFQTAINNNTIPEPTNPSNVYVLFLDDATG